MNNTGISVPKLQYKALFQMSIQWRHLKLLKWGGRGHDPTGATGMKSGELAVVYLALILGSICLRDGRTRPLECGMLCRAVP